MLQKTNPLVYQEFHANGNFAVPTNNNDFSSMVLDQRHEQLNKDKEVGIWMSSLVMKHSLTLQPYLKIKCKYQKC